MLNVTRKSFIGKFTAKIDFSFYVTIADVWILKSLYTLLDTYLDHMLVKFEENCMVRIRTIQNFKLFGQKKNG